MSERQVEAFRLRQHAEALRREHFKKIEGKRRLILQGAPALFYDVDADLVPEPGDRFTVGSHSVRVGLVQKVRNEADEQLRVQLIHDERAMYLGTRPPTAVETGRKSFSFAEEHGYASSDQLDGGGIVLPEMERRRQAEERAVKARKVKRATENLIRYERRLIDSRKKGRDGTAKVMELKVREAKEALRRAA